MNRLTWVAAALLALAPIAIVYCRPDDPMPPREPVARGTVVDVGFRVNDDLLAARTVSPQRDLFGFVEQAPAPRVVVPPTPPGPSLTLGVTEGPAVVVTQPPPSFPHRYLGRFGPNDAPFAVFSVNGDVVNVRVGEAVGGGWVLRRIGIESVDVALGDITQRIPM